MKRDRLSISRYPVYKDSGVEWMGEVPKHWAIKRVKEFAIIANGSTPKSSVPENWEGNYAWVTTDDLGKLETKFIKNSKRTITEIGFKSCGTTLCPEGSIVLSCRAPIGHIGILSIQACTNQGCKTLIVNQRTKRTISSMFIFYSVLSSKEKLQALGRGTTFIELSTKELSLFNLALPPLSEQIAIADYLDTKTAQIDRKIDLLTQKAEQYGNLKQSLINETVTRGFDQSVPMKDSEGEWFDCVPSDWNEKRVKDLFRLITDVAPDNNDYELLSVYASIGVRPRKDLEQRGNKASTTDGYWIVKKGDIVVNKLLAWMGSIGLSNYEGVTSPAYDVLRKLNNDIEERFYGYLFRTGKAQEIFKKSSRGIMDMRLRLYFDKLGAITVPVPPIAEQKSIADYLDTKTAQIERFIQSINTQIEKLKELRKTLINDVVTGKIKVV